MKGNKELMRRELLAAQKRNDQKRAEDQKQALAFLAGIVDRNKKGLPVLRYLDGEEEKEARAALVRLLVSRELSSELFHALALLFDPQALDKSPFTASRHADLNHWNARFRQLFFKRRRGAPPKRYQHGAIGFEIYCNIVSDPSTSDPPMSLARAKAEAAKKYHLSSEAIQAIWEEHGKLWNLRRPGMN
jgi:hypothetical protein